MIKLAFVFQHAPHGTSYAREGLDALLAASAFCDEDQLAVFFMDDGVLNLLPLQQPETILQKDFSRMLKLLDLYDIEQRFVCQESLAQWGITEGIIDYQVMPRESLLEKLAQAEKILTF